jgi:SAM-dependent methyltransferase
MPAERTAAECDVLTKWLTLPDFRRVLDVCCGRGRHGRELARRGWQVTGVELDADLVHDAKKEEATPGFTIMQGDMRDLSGFTGKFDAAVNLWQSFGHFDPDENAAVLRGLTDSLRPGGRLVLDIITADFSKRTARAAALKKPAASLLKPAIMDDRVLHVSLDYGDGHTDRFSWNCLRGGNGCPRRRLRLTHLDACAAFDPLSAPDRTFPGCSCSTNVPHRSGSLKMHPARRVFSMQAGTLYAEKTGKNPHPMTNYHLLPQDDRWKLTTESGDRIFSGIENKEQALANAIAVVQETHTAPSKSTAPTAPSKKNAPTPAAPIRGSHRGKTPGLVLSKASRDSTAPDSSGAVLSPCPVTFSAEPPRRA